MELATAYQGTSELQTPAGRDQLLRLAANLARDPVAFDAPLRDPVRFREAISALHDVVVSDLRFQPRDKSAYEAWKRGESERLAAIRDAAYRATVDEGIASRGDIPQDIEGRYHTAVRRYWRVRDQYARYLRLHDPTLWRQLMPCDPVVTVGEGVLFFECFSADQSSYGCLTVDRDEGFGGSGNQQPGTTNVDYSWRLYEHFQSLRSYRPARLQVDPTGISVTAGGAGELREEKIDLPQGWLRGFMQLQVAMVLPKCRVRLSREAVYNLVAWLRRHRARESPRSIRFELTKGRPPHLILEPWEQGIPSRSTEYWGTRNRTIRIWGRRRLLVLSRLLPMIDHVDVYLLGTGLPSFWVASLGAMRLTLGLSGWTTNNWVDGAAVDLMAPPISASDALVESVAAQVRGSQACSFDEIVRCQSAPGHECAAATHHLAHAGQLIFDLAANVFRWRQIMPRACGEAELGPEPPELIASRGIGRRDVEFRAKRTSGDDDVLAAVVEGRKVELQIATDGSIVQMQCDCSHFYKFGSRGGPCRHVLAVRRIARQGRTGATDANRSWFERWTNLSR